ncbi:LamG-like jellyroll fold domain-containing protein [Saccharothrix isguenensis]
MRARRSAAGAGPRACGVGLVAAVVAGLLLPSVAAAEPVVPDSAPDEVTAVRYAQEAGKSVVVDSATTETDEVRAHPDGTLTLVQHVQPVRVRRGEGWAPVDLTLERKPDGSFGPKASTVEVAFSPGGKRAADEPLAKVVQGGREVGLRWDGALPEPVVDGATLTYPDVLPDVDLRVEAHHEGFSELLVIKTPDAARNPALDTVTFRTHAKDVRVEHGSAKREGDLLVKDAAGAPVFVGDASQMWDSSGKAPRGREGDPVHGDRQAEMDVEITPDAVAITPDQAFLEDPATTYPVVLDPEYYCTNCGKVHHAVVQSPWGSARNFDATGGQLGDLKAGYLNKTSLGSNFHGVSRSYLQMNTQPIVGKHIISATLHTKVIHTYSCAPSATELWTAGWIDANTTWDNQPGWSQYQSESNVRNNAAHCPTDGGAGFTATSAVQAAASGSWGWTTFVLKAKHEDQLDTSWRRFDLNPYLEVRYNSYPNQPQDMGIEGWGPDVADALPCRIGADRARVGTKVPRLRARLSDPDGGRMDAGFRLLHGPHNSYTWNGHDLHTGDVWSGNFAEVQVPAGWITADGVYTWHLWSGDYQLSSWSPNCEFEVDTTAPNAPSVTSADYPTGTDSAHGSIGRTGLFTFTPVTPAGQTMDVAAYKWSLDNSAILTHTTPVSSADGRAVAAITPTQVLNNDLYVAAVDKTGNQSPPVKYSFKVAEPAGHKAAWSFNHSSGTVAEDSTNGNRDLTLTGGASFAPGYASNALVLDGVAGHAASASAVVNTSRAFSVSAWVKMDRKDRHLTVVGQDGNRASAFYLQYAGDVDRWAVTTPSSDADAPASYARVTSIDPAQVGVWTHLLATYEPNSRALALYVDGKLQGSTTATVVATSGSLTVGRAKSAGAHSNHFPGAIDYVQVWDRQVSADEAANHANMAVMRARFALDEQTGTTTLEQVSRQQATISGGVTWAGTPVDPDDPNQVPTGEDKWVNFDASWTGEVAAPGPANFRTDRSYTVSAWVRHGGFDAASRAAVALGDAQHSPFMLSYRGNTGKWGFLMSKGPAGDGWFAVSDLGAVQGEWVHLVGVYDAPRGQMSLYVNGDKQESFVGTAAGGTGVTGWRGAGPLWVGRAIWTGKKSDVWKGDVDDVRVYSGVLSDNKIDELRLSTHHQ